MAAGAAVVRGVPPVSGSLGHLLGSPGLRLARLGAAWIDAGSLGRRVRWGFTRTRSTTHAPASS